ncbi:MAG: protein arginine kinase [Calditrichaeota bacterium]|nr:protein arginine kinase [Calditrichota bacterium]
MTLDFDTLVYESPPWLDCNAPDSDVVLSSRIRLARNLGHVPFPNHAKPEMLEGVLNRVKEAYPSVEFLNQALFFDMGQLSGAEQYILAERRIISPEFVEKSIPEGLILEESGHFSVMINEEDHLRLQALDSGFQPERLWAMIEQIDRQMSHVVDYAFSEEFGFLTACPTNTGTGLRVSLFVQLPALSLTERLEEVLKKKPPSGLIVRGFYGEGSDVVGNIYQISNQFTLGWTEWRILEDIEEVVREIIRQERLARLELIEEDRIHLEDRVFRALGVIERARLISSLEFIELFASIKLGIVSGLLPEIDHQTVNNLLVQTQPAHIQRLAGRALAPLERDVYRAEFVRNKLNL